MALVALLKLGATPVNVNYRYRVAEMAHLLSGSGARGAVADADLAAAVTEAGARVVVTVAPGGGFGPDVDAAPRLPRRTRGDAEWVLYTGGTTGSPKAVLGRQSERLHAAPDRVRDARSRPGGPGGVAARGRGPGPVRPGRHGAPAGATADARHRPVLLRSARSPSPRRWRCCRDRGPPGRTSLRRWPGTASPT